MFRFAKDGLVCWPVSVPQVQEDGSIADQTFTVTYERLTKAERKQRDATVSSYLKQWRALLDADGPAEVAEQQQKERIALTEARAKIDDDLLRKRVKGWAGVTDQEGQPLSFSADVLEAFIDDDLLRNTLLQGLVDASAGAKSKNSLPGLAGLPVPAQA